MTGSSVATLEYVAELSREDIFFYVFCPAQKTSSPCEVAYRVNEQPEDHVLIPLLLHNSGVILDKLLCICASVSSFVNQK